MIGDEYSLGFPYNRNEMDGYLKIVERMLILDLLDRIKSNMKKYRYHLNPINIQGRRFPPLIKKTWTERMKEFKKT